MSNRQLNRIRKKYGSENIRNECTKKRLAEGEIKYLSDVLKWARKDGVYIASKDIHFKAHKGTVTIIDS